MNKYLRLLEREIGFPLISVHIEDLAVQRHPCYSVDPRSNVVGLNLSNLRLEKIPESLRLFGTLNVLRLFGNRLHSVPEWLKELSKLSHLYLGMNQFSEIPDQIKELKNLKVLALNYNKLTWVKPILASLDGLKKLGLSGNRIKSLPENIGGMVSLEGLYLANNDLSVIPEWINNLRNLHELILSHNKISKINFGAGVFPNLEFVGLRETNMQSFPPSLLTLSNLKRLDFSGVQISSLPSQIGNLGNLRSLDLNGTRIDRLPDELSALGELRHLDLSSTRIAEIPKSILNLRQLEYLNLSGTRMRSVPKEISNLESLISLDLSAIGLASIPSEVFRLPNLNRLNLAGNRIREIPWQITQSPLEIFWRPRNQQSGIFVGGNPLESPPLEILQSGTQAIHSYFHSLQGVRRPIDEVKILLVGDGGAGKTSLVKRLMGRTFDAHEPQTHGINIDEFQITTYGKRIKVHFWDFGGQEIMHATHQFFLSKRSAYLLVLDGRKDEKTEYWLKHIEVFGGDSPVLVVLNKIDEHASFDVNRRFLLEKYPGIKGFFRISCKAGEGVRELLDALSKTLARMEHTKTTWAMSWFNVKQRMERMHEDYINFSRFQEICLEQGVEDSSAQNTLIDFLHDLGVVLHFKDLPLKDTNVINPRWVTEGVYRIVNSKEIASVGGVLQLDLLQDVLDPLAHPIEKHNFIIELMKKFELCYDLDRERVLLPGLLPVEEPDVRFGAENALRFVIDYDFLPKSIMPRFIVRMHEDIDGNHRWRTGVYLSSRDLGVRALVRADELERRVTLMLVGVQRRDYLGIILHAFRKINESFERLSFVEKVPMPDAPEVMVSYSHLMLLEAKGISSYLPDGSEKEYEVQDLLGAVRPKRRTEEEILAILQELRKKGDSAETLLEKANKSILLQPNFFGVGVNINDLINRVLKR